MLTSEYYSVAEKDVHLYKHTLVTYVWFWVSFESF